MRSVYIFILCCLTVLVGACASAEEAGHPFLHELFTDNMVLQRDIAAPVWGWAEPGKQVTVSMNGKTASAVAGSDGQWMARIGPFKAGGPYTLTVVGSQTVTLNNVLVGDVWICSGQSNMEMGIGNVTNAQAEVASADFPNIRLFTVPRRIAMQPQAETQAHWLVCTPENVSTGSGGWNGFSAVGFFFGRYLNQHLKVPIGLIHTSWGGTIAEAWTSGSALKQMPDFAPAVAQVEQAAQEAKNASASYADRLEAWYVKNEPGSIPGGNWSDPALDASAWKTMQLPQYWEGAGLPGYDGVVWFRREFTLPDGWGGKDIMLHLGPVDDMDTTYINGVKVGAQFQYDTMRDYKVPAALLKPGRNVIAVRVLDTGGNGGFFGKPEQMKLEIAGDTQTPPLSLAGPWLYKDSLPLAKATPVPLQTASNPNVATVLYNGMIAPLIPFGVKGAIWYQGESNAGRAYQYRTLLPTMIRDWRARFGVGEFPFYIVQLANFTAVQPNPGDSDWAELREAQSMTAKTVGHSGAAVLIDIGDANDIHPKDKQDVGKRLALIALANTYGASVEYSGPVYRSMDIMGSAVRLNFDHVAGGLMAKGDKLQGFAIAGEDHKFVWADAVIKGDTVVVSSPEVPNPVAVRYGWATNPVCNLYNKVGLPASPFRTDTWPGITINNH